MEEEERGAEGFCSSRDEWSCKRKTVHSSSLRECSFSTGGENIPAGESIFQRGEERRREGKRHDHSFCRTLIKSHLILMKQM